MTTNKGLKVTHDEVFLRHFRIKERVMKLTDEDMAEVRKNAEMGDVYAKYGYGRWFFYNNPTGTAMSEAEQLFLAAKDYVPDAMAAYALMLRYGDTNENVMDIEESNRLLETAISRGSELAKQQMARFRIFGLFCEAEPEKVAKEIEKRMETGANNSGSCNEAEKLDPYWHMLLAHAYESSGRKDDAILQFEKAARAGEANSLFYLANIYMERDDKALYEETMEKGIAQGSGLCCILHAGMNEDDFLELTDDEQQRMHQEVEERLQYGLSLGEGYCAFYLWLNNYFGGLGYTKDDSKALHYLRIGAKWGNTSCIEKLAELAEVDELPEPMTTTDIAELWLKAARYTPGDEDALRGLSNVSDPSFLLRHQDELERYWMPKIDELPDAPEPPEEIEKTPIPPSVIIIWPTGHLDIVEANVFAMKSYSEMARELINADGLDAIHYSSLLYKISNDVGLDTTLAMYCDRDGYAKDLPDNAIGTMLYGRGKEIRGPIIIALEDCRHDCHSFTTQEDLVATYTEINKHCGGLLIVKDEEDGRFDAYA